MGGALGIFDGISAFRYKGALAEALQDALFGHRLSTDGVALVDGRDRRLAARDGG